MINIVSFTKQIFNNNFLDNNHFMWGLNHIIIFVKSLTRTYPIFQYALASMQSNKIVDTST